MMKIPLLLALFFVASGLVPQVKGDCYKKTFVGVKINLNCGANEENRFCCDIADSGDQECCNLTTKIVNWIQTNQQIVIIVAAVVALILLVMLIVSIIKCCCCC